MHTNVFVEGLRIETSDKDPSYRNDGIPEILAGSRAVIRLFGYGFTEDTLVTFTDEPANRTDICDKIRSSTFPVSVQLYVLFYSLNKYLYMCITILC